MNTPQASPRTQPHWDRPGTACVPTAPLPSLTAAPCLSGHSAPPACATFRPAVRCACGRAPTGLQGHGSGFSDRSCQTRLSALERSKGPAQPSLCFALKPQHDQYFRLGGPQIVTPEATDRAGVT